MRNNKYAAKMKKHKNSSKICGLNIKENSLEEQDIKKQQRNYLFYLIDSFRLWIVGLHGNESVHIEIKRSRNALSGINVSKCSETIEDDQAEED